LCPAGFARSRVHDSPLPSVHRSGEQQRNARCARSSSPSPADPTFFTSRSSPTPSTAAPATNVAAIETTLDWTDLAAIPESYATAWPALHGNLELQPGESLLVRGGTSALGQAAINLAADLGAADVVIDAADGGQPGGGQARRAWGIGAGQARGRRRPARPAGALARSCAITPSSAARSCPASREVLASSRPP
jgi:hypothetical protein